ncbi:MAG: formylglycine-generating enzyme family protein [Spirochaetota bacterium]
MRIWGAVVGSVVLAVVLAGCTGATGPVPAVNVDGGGGAWRDADFGMVTVVAADSTAQFDMGASDGEDDEKPTRTVTLSVPYSMNTREITNAQYAAVLNEALDEELIEVVDGTSVRNAAGDPKELLDLDAEYARIRYADGAFAAESGRETHPVTEVTWYGAAAFAAFLNSFEDQAETYDLSDWSVDAAAAGYRLPTEAEWEYAARGGADGKDTAYAGSDTIGDVAWYADAASDTQAVGGKSENELEIFDLSGNVWEWVGDWYKRDYYADDESSDPVGPDAGERRVLRGGSFFDDASAARVSNRGSATPDASDVHIGFRLVKVLQP